MFWPGGTPFPWVRRWRRRHHGAIIGDRTEQRPAGNRESSQEEEEEGCAVSALGEFRGAAVLLILLVSAWHVPSAIPSLVIVMTNTSSRSSKPLLCWHSAWGSRTRTPSRRHVASRRQFAKKNLLAHSFTYLLMVFLTDWHG